MRLHARPHHKKWVGKYLSPESPVVVYLSAAVVVVVVVVVASTVVIFIVGAVLLLLLLSPPPPRPLLLLPWSTVFLAWWLRCPPRERQTWVRFPLSAWISSKVESHKRLKSWHSNGYPARRQRWDWLARRQYTVSEIESLVCNIYLSVAVRSIV